MTHMGLEAVQLGFTYHPGPPVLRDVSIQFPPGAITAIIGPNGCGKSTLLRLLMGLRTPGAGRVLLGGQDVSDLRAPNRAGRLAYIPQSSTPCFAFTTEYVVALGGFASGRGLGTARAREALARVGMEDRAGDVFGTLSAGQQQRVTLARALVQIDAAGEGSLEGRYVVADEPLGAMDPAKSVSTARLLRGLVARGLGVAMVVHDVSLALGFADRVVLMTGRGEVAAQGATDSTLTASALEGVFGVAFAALGEVGGGARAMVPVVRGR
jgi:iron complex transport system ATP-binding protein